MALNLAHSRPVIAVRKRCHRDAAPGDVRAPDGAVLDGAVLDEDVGELTEPPFFRGLVFA
jgi:hypothetical protein